MGNIMRQLRAALKLAIAQAFSIIRWDEKLENIPADMVDGCYNFAGVHIESLIRSAAAIDRSII